MNRRPDIYLDHAATTAMRPEVIETMAECMAEHFGNPSSVHRRGREARNVLEEARERAAAVLGAQRREIVFTGGGTEADNAAVLGRARRGRHTVVCSAIEHKAVLSAARQAATEADGRLILLGVDDQGRVDVGALEEALRERPDVVSVMWGNNEVGTLQPVATIGERCAAAGVPFHSDAVQAFGKVPVRVDAVRCDLLALSGHKFGGPRGVGVLYLRADADLAPVSFGGGQERALRPGTENVAGAVGIVLAMELAARDQQREAARYAGLRERLESGLRDALPEIEIYGAEADRLPHVCSVCVPDTDAETFLYGLDLEGLAVSGGSACQSGTSSVSHVLTAMGRVRPGAAVARLSFGHTTTVEDVERALDIFVRVADRARTAVQA